MHRVGSRGELSEQRQVLLGHRHRTLRHSMACKCTSLSREATMKILITGCAGYIGSVLTGHLLEHGHWVVGLDSLRHGGSGLLGFIGHPLFRFVKGDIRDKAIVSEALSGVEAVVHLAALVGEPECKQNPKVTRDINLRATRSLANAAKGAGVEHFILASTCSNYGVTEPGEIATEESELKPLSLYAETKIGAESAVQLAASDDFAVTVLRFATVYGLSPRMRFDLLINEFARDAVAGWLLVYGAQSWRPFVHVRDVAKFVKWVLAERLCGVFNVGGHNRRKVELVEALREIVPDLAVEFKKTERDPRDYRVSFSKAGQFGFASYCTPEDGLQRIVTAIQMGLFQDVYSGQHRNA